MAYRWLRRSLLLGGVLLLTGMSPSPAEAVPLHDYRHDRDLAREAHAIAVQAARDFLFEGRKPQDPSAGSLDSRLKVPGGAFVTIVLDGQTRGCWGTLHPQRPMLAQEIAAAAVAALRIDYRHRPIARHEWPELEFYVSLVGPLEPIDSIGAVRPKYDGLFVTNGRRGGVLLPGEAKTARWQLAEARRKAGLRPGEPAAMFRFPTVVYGPEDAL